MVGRPPSALQLRKQIATLQDLATFGKFGGVSAPLAAKLQRKGKADVTTIGGPGAYVYDENNIPVLLRNLPQAKAAAALATSRVMLRAAQEVFWSKGAKVPHIEPSVWVNTGSTKARKEDMGNVPQRGEVPRGLKKYIRDSPNRQSRPLYESGQLISGLRIGAISTNRGFIAGIGFTDDIHEGRRGLASGDDSKRPGDRPTVAKLAAILEDGSGDGKVPAFRWMAKTADLAGPTVTAMAAAQLREFVSSHNDIPVSRVTELKASGPRTSAIIGSAIASDPKLQRMLRRGF